MWSKKAISYLDKWYVPCGSCWFCGHKDKRHRMWDMFINFSDDTEVLARVYEVPIEYVQTVRMIKPFHRGGKIPTTNLA